MMRVIWIFLIVLLLSAPGCAPSQVDAPSEPQAPPAEDTSAPVFSDSASPGDTTEMTATPADFPATSIPEASTPRANTQMPPSPRSRVTIMSAETVPTPMSGNLRDLIERTKEDLARRLGGTSEEIKVLLIEKAEWPDTSLGCAAPGLSRRPITVPGYRIVLSAMEREYVYHTNRDRGIVFCPKG